jgi:hypothetical protein
VDVDDSIIRSIRIGGPSEVDGGDAGLCQPVQDDADPLPAECGAHPVEEDEARPRQDDAQTGQELLLAERQQARPIALGIQPIRPGENGLQAPSAARIRARVPWGIETESSLIRVRPSSGERRVSPS